MKKSIILFLIFTSSLFSYSASTEQIDKYWLHYVHMNTELTKLLKNVRSASDYAPFKERAKELIKKNKESYAQFNFQNEDAAALFGRYRYHIQNRTPLGLKLQEVGIAFMSELRRISKMPGGKEFLKENNLTVRQPSQNN